MNKEGKQWTKKETKIQKNKQTPVLTNLLYMCLYLYVFASLRIVVFCCFLLFAALFAVVCCAVCRLALHAGRVLLALVAFDWEVWRGFSAGKRLDSRPTSQQFQQRRGAAAAAGCAADNGDNRKSRNLIKRFTMCFLCFNCKLYVT